MARLGLTEPAHDNLHPATPTLENLLTPDEPLLLHAAHDALTARILQQAGFKAYQVGGFALAGARHAIPIST